jgi:hypothetical protein
MYGAEQLQLLATNKEAPFFANCRARISIVTVSNVWMGLTP